jgi:hypothetical protein
MLGFNENANLQKRDIIVYEVTTDTVGPYIIPLGCLYYCLCQEDVNDQL